MMVLEAQRQKCSRLVRTSMEGGGNRLEWLRVRLEKPLEDCVP